MPFTTAPRRISGLDVPSAAFNDTMDSDVDTSGFLTAELATATFICWPYGVQWSFLRDLLFGASVVLPLKSKNHESTVLICLLSIAHFQSADLVNNKRILF